MRTISVSLALACCQAAGASTTAMMDKPVKASATQQTRLAWSASATQNTANAVQKNPTGATERRQREIIKNPRGSAGRPALALGALDNFILT